MLMFLNKMRKSKVGYTLTELIVVISVLGILAVVATPFIGDYVSNAKKNTDAANAKLLQDVIQRANLEHIDVGTPEIPKAFKLSTADANDIKAVMAKMLVDGVPAVQEHPDYDFFVNKNTGKVEAKLAGAALIDIIIQ